MIIGGYVGDDDADYPNAVPLNNRIVTTLVPMVEAGFEDDGMSYLNKLSSFHYTYKVDAPHITLQAGWLQVLLLGRLGSVAPEKLTDAATKFNYANSKSSVKAAHQQTFGREIQHFDNMHFYPPAGAKSGVTVKMVFQKLKDAMKELGTVGQQVIAQDTLFFASARVAPLKALDYELKDGDLPEWRKLEVLIDAVIALRTNRKIRYGELTDALKRLSANSALDPSGG